MIQSEDIMLFLESDDKEIVNPKDGILSDRILVAGEYQGFHEIRLLNKTTGKYLLKMFANKETMNKLSELFKK